MDFANYVNAQLGFMSGHMYVRAVWESLCSNEVVEVDENVVHDFKGKLPILYEAFWKAALGKLENDEGSSLTCDDHMQVYLPVMIYYYLSNSSEFSAGTVLDIANVYVLLLNSNQTDEFYNSHVYRAVCNLMDMKKLSRNNVSLIKLIRQLRLFYSKRKFNTDDLEFTLETLNTILFTATDTYVHLGRNEKSKSCLLTETLLCYKHLLECHDSENNKCTICFFVLAGVRGSQTNYSPNLLKMVQSNYRELIQCLAPIFDSSSWWPLTNAIMHIWQSSNFHIDECIKIMNMKLKKDDYISLMDRLILMLYSTAVNKSIIKLSQMVILEPATCLSPEELYSYNENLIAGVLLNALSEGSEGVRHAALECVSALISAAKNIKSVDQIFSKLFNKSHLPFLTVPVMAAAISNISVSKWTSKCKNKQAFALLLAIISYTENSFYGNYKEVLETLTEDASPYDLKPFITPILQTFGKLCVRGHDIEANFLFDLMIRMSMHGMASATDFLKHLYSTMQQSTVETGDSESLPIGAKLIDNLFARERNSNDFFRKCHSLNLIKSDHVTILIKQLDTLTETQWKFLCAIALWVPNKNIVMVSDYITQHMDTLVPSAHLKYLTHLYTQMLTATPDCLNNHRQSLEAMMNFLKVNLSQQSFHYDALPNVFCLYKRLVEIFDCENDVTTLQAEYDVKLETALVNNDNPVPIVYFAEMVMFFRILPNQSNISNLRDLLYAYSKNSQRVAVRFNVKVWIASLNLYTYISFFKNDCADSCVDLLKGGLKSTVTDIKLVAIHLLFDLSKLVTHNFDCLIDVMFDEIVDGEMVFKQSCLMQINQLMQDEYLKLDVVQYLRYICILGDENYHLSSYLTSILNRNFFQNHISIIAKYFISMIVNAVGYREHPIYSLSEDDYFKVELQFQKVHDRHELYKLLFKHLPTKSQFHVISDICNNIFNKMTQDEFDYGAFGFSNLVLDLVFMFKQMGKCSYREHEQGKYYKTIMRHVSERLLKKYASSSSRRNYELFQNEILYSTISLLKLLYLFEKNRIVSNVVKCGIFNAIIYWTDFMMPEIQYLIHTEHHQLLQKNYRKLETFYNNRLTELHFNETYTNRDDEMAVPLDENERTEPLFSVYVEPYLGKNN